MGRDALIGRPKWIAKGAWNELAPHAKIAIMNFDYTVMTDDGLIFDEDGNIIYEDKTWTETH
jgi:hypothetical protein